MPRIFAAAVGAFTLAVSMAAVPAAVADSDRAGKLEVTPSTALPGQRVSLLAVDPELNDSAAVRSEAFSKTVELKLTGKVSLEAHAKVRCDAKPGTYDIRFTEPIHRGEDTLAGKIKVEAGKPIGGTKCVNESADDESDTMPVGIIAGVVSAVAAVAAAGAIVVIRSRRRSKPAQ